MRGHRFAVGLTLVLSAIGGIYGVFRGAREILDAWLGRALREWLGLRAAAPGPAPYSSPFTSRLLGTMTCEADSTSEVSTFTMRAKMTSEPGISMTEPVRM